MVRLFFTALLCPLIVCDGVSCGVSYHLCQGVYCIEKNCILAALVGRGGQGTGAEEHREKDEEQQYSSQSTSFQLTCLYSGILAENLVSQHIFRSVTQSELIAEM